MTRVKHAVSSRRHRKKALKFAKGFWGAKSRQYKIAKEAVRHALIDNYEHRKNRKREFRGLWITRISAACKAEGISYSKFISALKKAHINLDRKMLADIAVNDYKSFKALVAKVK